MPIVHFDVKHLFKKHCSKSCMFSTWLWVYLCRELFLQIKLRCNFMSVNTETESLFFYLNDHFIDNTLTHFLEVIETRVARKRTEQ